MVTNAVLQWVPEHRALLRKWVAALPSGAWFAMQVPGNLNAPSHVLLRQLAASGEWAERLRGANLRDADAVDDPIDYANLFAELGCRVDAWETTYAQRLTGPDAVLEWITGTALRPVKAALGDAEWTRFRAQLAPMLDEVYPPRPDGTTWFPFRRVFAVAKTPDPARPPIEPPRRGRFQRTVRTPRGPTSLHVTGRYRQFRVPDQSWSSTGPVRRKGTRSPTRSPTFARAMPAAPCTAGWSTTFRYVRTICSYRPRPAFAPST